MKQHVTFVGALHLGLGVLNVVAAAIVAAVLIGSGWLVAVTEGEGAPLGILSAVALGVGGLLLVLALPGIVGGWGLLKFKPWARYLVLVLAALNLFNIPLGTAAGIYTFWALLQPETEQLFAGTAAV